MADEIVEHRFVQIHKACESASLNGSDIWGALNSNSTIATSHACDKIFSLVTNEKKLDLFQTIQNFQNLIFANDDPAKTQVFVRYITRLLIFNEQLKQKKIKFYHSKTDTYKLHPFAAIVKQKPNVYFYLLDEIDYLFKEEQNAMVILGGFVKSVFFNEHTVDANAILTRLTNNILYFGTKDKQILSSIYTTFSQLFVDFPLKKDSVRYFMVLDFLLWITSSVATFIKCENIGSACDFLYLVLDRMLTTCSEGYPVNSYLNRLERIMKAGLVEGSLDIVWSSLSYGLLKVQTLEEQQLIMSLMQAIINFGTCTTSVLHVAYLPLYQLMSELNDKSASTEVKNLKNNVLDLIGYLDHQKPVKGDREQSIKKIQDIIGRNKIYGLLSHIFIHLSKLYRNISPVEDEDYNIGPETTLSLNILFSTPFVYSENEDLQCLVYSSIAELSSIQETCYKFPVFLFLLRILRSNCDNPRLVTHIFKDVIPTLADTNDPIMTSKILQVILSSIASGNNSFMACLGVKALSHAHQLQPRVWQELKRVFNEWVSRRKSVTLRRKVDLSNTGPIKMELAILTSMRDACQEKPNECTPDVLPMVISLLQACQDLSMSSLSIIVSIINIAIKTGLVEPRSIWNVSVVYLAQFVLEHGAKRSSLLIQQLCEFYSIAGSKDDLSEPYLQFKESLLTDFIVPLIESGEERVVGYALKALSSFPAQDIAVILPEKATEYIKKITPQNDCPKENQHLVLSTLMSNELDHMRRGLFKEEQQPKQHVVEPAAAAPDILNESGEAVGKIELEVNGKLMELWDNAHVAPGLRSGYAIAMLHAIDLPATVKIKSKEEAWNTINKSKWYRFMVTQFTDVSLTDHLLLRISSVGSWETFFRNTVLSDMENDIETIITLLIQDLLGRLERSTIPGVSCNITLAITGVVHALRLFIPSLASSCAAQVIDKLMKHYIDLAGSPLSHAAHLMSEEVQFAARFALGYLGPCVMNNEQLVHSVFNHLRESAVTNTNLKYKNIDTTIDLVQFANGYAAGHFVAELTVYPAMTESIEHMRDTGFSSLLSYCQTETISDSRLMGILMGLSSGLTSESLTQDVLSFAVSTLKSYLQGESVTKGCLLGSLWLSTLGAKQKDHIDYKISSLVESVLASASNDPNLVQHFYHFTVCYTQIQYHSYLFADTSSEATEEFYKQAFEPLFKSIETDDASSNYRIACVFGIGSLFGLNYLYTSRERLYIEFQRYYADLRQPGLDTLVFLAGINSRSTLVGNLKSGRIAAAVCGKVIEHAKILQRVISSTDASGGQSRSADASSMSLLSASSEPSNYSRLNSNTSYLRAVFDQLVWSSQQESCEQVKHAEMLLESLIETPGPLPPVNWFNVLIKLVKKTSRLRDLCFSFAATHGSTSFSLSEFLMTQMTGLLKAVQPTQPESLQFLFSKNGTLHTLLSLSGLATLDQNKSSKRRGMNAVTKKISISQSRIIELVQLITQKFKWLKEEVQYDILTVMAYSLNNSPTGDESVTKLVSALRDILYHSITLPLLSDLNFQEKEAWLVEKSTACSVAQIEQILPTGQLKDWQETATPLVFQRITSLCTFYRLQSDKTKWVKYLSTAITHLIGLPIETSHQSWHTIAETINQDCQSDKDALGWTIRVLDGFVVSISAILSSDKYNDEQMLDSLQVGLRSILVELRSSPNEVGSTEIELADTIYLMSCMIMIGEEHKTQQEQIVKRIFKLIDLIQKLDGQLSLSFFNHIALSFPQEYLIQYESNY